jgi:hypothetical protein
MAHQPGKVAFDGRPRLWWRLMGVALLLLCTTGAQAAPAHDELANATVITALPFTDGPLDTTTATTAAHDPDCRNDGHTVWYVVTPTADLPLAVTTVGSDYDTTLSVYTGTPGALTQLVCNDDFGSLQSQVAFQAVAGTTYYIMVGSYGSGPGGSLFFQAVEGGPPPQNDEVTQATVITALPFTDGPLDTTTATTAADDPDCRGNGPTVWYVVTPAADLAMTVDTFGSDYDTTVSVYTGAPGALTPLACNDDFQIGENVQSQVAFQAVAGTTYYIMVGSYGSGPGGSLFFHAVGVTGPTLGASVFGIIPHTAVCTNVTTGQQVTLSDPSPTWDCETAGLRANSGDRVTMHVRGRVEQGATDVGGAVVGMAPTSGGCTNLTTGQQVKFQHMVGATAASCVAAGLVVQPGNTVQMSVQGAVE